VYYDLVAEADKLAADRPAIVRIEQLYSFPENQLVEILKGYSNLREVVWAQEEPRNMGAWSFIDGRLWNLLEQLADARRLTRVSRALSASPAAGQMVVHQQELAQLLDESLG
jgi:2-oxoglutarate dehydrogenase E1 component